MSDREIMIDMLKKGEVIVEFLKKDGELRIMPCTLNPELIPMATPKVVDESKPARKVPEENPDVIRVFCTDKQEWRSFRINSVISMVISPSDASE